MSSPKILAIDPSSTFVGVYDGTGGEVIKGGDGERAERLANIGYELSEVMNQGEPYDFVVYEEQFVRGDAATRCLYGAVGIIEAVAINSGAGVMPVPQGTLRQWASKIVGKKFKGKELYKTIACHYDRRLMASTTSEHVLDAAAVYYFIQHNGEFDG